MSTSTRVIASIVALVLGAVFGVAGTIGQAAQWQGWWVGLAVALIGCAALLVAVRALTDDRWPTAAAAAGMVLAMAAFSSRGPGGSVVVPAAPEGQISSGVVWMFVLPIVAVIVVAWPSRMAFAPKDTN